MARLAGKMRGDIRAMEEEHERHNPVRGGMRGCGATPSMGLSQFRGGRKHKNEVMMMDSDSDEELEGGGFLSDLGIPVVSQLAGMVGLGHGEAPARVVGGRKKAHSKAEKVGRLELKAHEAAHEALEGGMSDATRMGVHLGKHLHSLHGAGFFDDFVKGIGSAVSTLAPVAMKVLPLLAAGKPKRGAASNSDTGAYNGEGLLGQDGHGIRRGGRKKRAPAGPEDGRRKRAEIVRKVMAEKGLKMIEASKYVKEHGLY